MTSHLAPEQIVAWLDGTLDAASERQAGAHLQACTDCTRRLQELRRFDEFVMTATTTDAKADSAMFAVAQRVLAADRADGRLGTARAPRAGPRRPGWFGPLLLAALALLAATLYAVLPGSATFGVQVRRYVPPDVVRGAVERFHLDLTVHAPCWPVVFATWSDGRLERLFPAENAALGTLGTPLPLPAGSRRLPADAMMDWEFTADRAPRTLWVVPMPQQPTEEQMTALREGFAAGGTEVLPAIAARFAGARAVGFPQ